MKTSAIHRIPWLLALLAGCADDAPGAIESTSSDGGTVADASPMTMSTSGEDDGVISATFMVDDTTDDGADSTTSDATDGTTASGSTGSTGDASSGTTESNAAPETGDDVYFTRQDQPLVTPPDGILANDSDPDGDAVSVADADAVSAGGGTVIVNADGGFAYTPAAGFWGTDTFAYTIEDEAGASATGSVTVFVGPVQIPLAQVAAGNGGFAIDGAAVGDQAGLAVSSIDDINGDGLDELVVGAPFVDDGGADVGRTYVVFGKADTGAVDLDALGGGGFAVTGAAGGDRAGVAVSRAGDVNNDGIEDIVIGAPLASTGGQYSGQAYVVFGKGDTGPVALSALNADGFAIDAEVAGDFMGYSVGAAGDVNGDGMDDVIVGASAASPNGAGSGRAYIVFGKANTATVDLTALGLEGYALNGETTGDNAGRGVSGIGDVNADMLADIVVGAPSAPGGDSNGRAYVVHGKDSDTDPVELSSLGTFGFALNGATMGDRAGFSVRSAGDINGDGTPDLVVGADGADGSAYTGRSYVVFGTAATETVEFSALGSSGFVMAGENADDRSGAAVSGAGDVNGDGLDDVLVGAWGADAETGRTYVVFGVDATDEVDLGGLGEGGFVLDGEVAGDRSGFTVSHAGDVNGDGVDDIIVGAPRTTSSGGNAGRAYVVFGVPTVPQ